MKPRIVELEPGESVLVRATVDFKRMDVKGYFGGDRRLITGKLPEEKAALERFVGSLKRNVDVLSMGNYDFLELDIRVIGDVERGMLDQRAANEAGFRALTQEPPFIEPHSFARRLVGEYVGQVFTAAGFPV